MASVITLAEQPVLLQGVVSPGYSAIDVRRAIAAELAQEGVVGSADYKVTPSAGVKQLAVAAGEAGVDGDSVTNQGRYYQRNGAAQTLDLATAPDLTNPRIDQLVLEIKDDAHDASGLSAGRLRVITGTPTAGATLDNRTGAAALPSTCIRLADVLVPANYNAVFIAGTHIRDRRPWARGGFSRIKRNANAAAGADYTTTSVTMVDVDATNLAIRMECSGAPVRVGMAGRIQSNTAGAGVMVMVTATGTQIDEAKTQVYSAAANADASGMKYFEVTYTPSPGSYLFKPQFQIASSGTAKLIAAANNALTFVVEELVRQDANNGTA